MSSTPRPDAPGAGGTPASFAAASRSRPSTNSTSIEERPSDVLDEIVGSEGRVRDREEARLEKEDRDEVSTEWMKMMSEEGKAFR